MFTEREFEKVSWLIRKLSYNVKSNLLSSTAEQNALFDAFQKEKNKIMDANNKKEQVSREISSYIRADIITCYAMLGYPKEYNEFDFNFYDLASYSELTNNVLYSGYVKYYTDSFYGEIRDLDKELFQIYRDITNFDPGRLSFYSILKKIESSQCDEYISTMQRIVQIMAENRTLSREASLWLKRMLYKPDVLTDAFHKE